MIKWIIDYFATQITTIAFDALSTRMTVWEKRINDLNARLIQQENLREEYEHYVRQHLTDLERRIKGQ